MASRPSIVVVGSVNLDIVATAERLPVAGETVTGAELNRYPGGKGANQALAAKRLGANVSLVACVGNDADADAALALLREGGVELSSCAVHPSVPTGVALISVSSTGENHIVVAPGANRQIDLQNIKVPQADALICQLEVPVHVLAEVSESFAGFVCVNLAPAAEVHDSLIENADLIVVNETEARYYGNRLNSTGALIARTLGAEGAELCRNGEVIVRSSSPIVSVADTTGAGDAFTAALTLALIEGQAPGLALDFACAAGAAAASKAGAQPSLPFRHEVEKLLG